MKKRYWYEDGDWYHRKDRNGRPYRIARFSCAVKGCGKRIQVRVYRGAPGWCYVRYKGLMADLRNQEYVCDKHSV